MNEIKIEILQISDDKHKGDAIIYIYSNSNLIDAVTFTKDFQYSLSNSIPTSGSETIQMVVKDLQLGKIIGSAVFKISDLISHPDSLEVSLKSSIPENSDSGFIVLRPYPKPETESSPRIRNASRENDIYRAAKSELEIEKWKNTGLMQLREEMNISELGRVSIVKKMCETAEKYEKIIMDLRQTSVSNKTKSNLVTFKNSEMQDELENLKTLISVKEKVYEDKIAHLSEIKQSQQREICRIRDETKTIKQELEEYKKPVEIEENQTTHLKISSLQEKLKKINDELMENKGKLKEFVQKIKEYQADNTDLRLYMQTIEDKCESSFMDSTSDLYQAITNHLEVMSISASIVKITENVFKIDDETLFLALKNGELLVQNGENCVSFVDWLQKNKWKKSEDDEVLVFCKKLDTVPEEDEEEEVVLISPPVSAKKLSKKGSPQKVSRGFSPVLHKRRLKV